MRAVENQVQGHLRKLKVHISVAPHDMHPQIPRKLADEMPKPPFVRFEWPGRTQPGEDPTHLKRDIRSLFKEEKNTDLPVPPLCPARP